MAFMKFVLRRVDDAGNIVAVDGNCKGMVLVLSIRSAQSLYVHCDTAPPWMMKPAIDPRTILSI